MKKEEFHLRALEQSDLDFLFNLENDVRLWKVSNTLLPFSRKTLSSYINNAHEDIFSIKQQRFVLSDSQQNPLGLIDLYDFDPVHHRAGVGIVIHSDFRGNGLAKKGLELLEKIAFNNLQLHQLFACVGSDNASSLQLFEKLGYVMTGVKKEWNFYDHKFHDEILFQKINHV